MARFFALKYTGKIVNIKNFCIYQLDLMYFYGILDWILDKIYETK